MDGKNLLAGKNKRDNMHCEFENCGSWQDMIAKFGNENSHRNMVDDNPNHHQRLLASYICN